MPNTREKLIELLEQVQYLGGLEEKVADHLIANGVTIATDNNVGEKSAQTDKDNNVPTKWIPVTERLPNRDDMVIAFYPTMCGTTGEMQIHKAWAMSETCTHWMPLPLPPEGE